MYNCFDVANKLLEFAKEDGKGIDTMKLLKLTYIAHGYYLAFFDKPLFKNSIQAWKYGPVIPELYHAIKPFKTGIVNPTVVSLHSYEDIKKEDEKYLRAVWNHYKETSGIHLSNLTHQSGTPWANVYSEGIINIPIDNDIIKEHYKQKIKEMNVG